MSGRDEEVFGYPNQYSIQEKEEEEEEEYGDETESLLGAKKGATLLVILGCFFGGLGPVVSWNSLYVGETYFSLSFGKSFLSIVGLLQNIPSLVVQILLVILTQKGITTKIGYQIPTMISAIVQICVLGGSFYVVASINGKEDVNFQMYLLYFLVLVNGTATGFSAGRYFSLAAEFPPHFIGYMVAGNAMGALLPTFLYLVFIFVYTVDNIEGLLLEVVFPVGVTFLFVQLVSFLLLKKTDLYKGVVDKNRKAARCGLVEREDGNFKAVNEQGETVVPEVPNFGLFGKHMISAWILSLGLACTMFVSLSLLSIVAFVPCIRFGYNLSFYLIASYNLGDLVGRQIGNKFALTNTVLYTLMGLRVLFIPIVMGYIAHPFISSGDAFIIVVYFLIAFSNGFCLVVGSANSQLICGFSTEDICPVVGSVSAVSMQFGLVTGVAFSLALSALVDPLQDLNSSDNPIFNNTCVTME